MIVSGLVPTDGSMSLNPKEVEENSYTVVVRINGQYLLAFLSRSSPVFPS